MSSITSWHNGGYQNPHLDTYSHQETAGKSESEIQNMNDGKPSKEWTCIVYLNEDFSMVVKHISHHQIIILLDIKQNQKQVVVYFSKVSIMHMEFSKFVEDNVTPLQFGSLKIIEKCMTEHTQQI